MTQWKHSVLLYLKGVGMGAADIVPGVSGGTMALILGVYSKLVNSLSCFDWQLLRLLFTKQFSRAWLYIDGRFLLTLVLGISSSILALSHAISYAMDHFPHYIWSLFSGITLASAIMLLRQIDHGVTTLLWLLAGITIITIISLQPRLPLPISSVSIILSAALAIMAMLLPGISGSFILLLLGMYQPLLIAVKQLNIYFISLYLLGALLGLLCFSRLLRYLLTTYREAILSLLTGMLLGSLLLLWPWKTEFDSIDLLTANKLPWNTVGLQLSDQLIMVALIVLGIVVPNKLAHYGEPVLQPQS